MNITFTDYITNQSTTVEASESLVEEMQGMGLVNTKLEWRGTNKEWRVLIVGTYIGIHEGLGIVEVLNEELNNV